MTNPDDEECVETTLWEEVNDIIQGILETLDEILRTSQVTWNTLFLANIIQAFTSHLQNLRDCHKAASVAVLTIFPMDVDYTRVRCHVQTMLSVCTANLSQMCGRWDATHVLNLPKNRRLPVCKRVKTAASMYTPGVHSRRDNLHLFASSSTKDRLSSNKNKSSHSSHLSNPSLHRDAREIEYFVEYKFDKLNKSSRRYLSQDLLNLNRPSVH